MARQIFVDSGFTAAQQYGSRRWFRGLAAPASRLAGSAGGYRMGTDLAASNVNRSYSLAATSIAIFTFMLFFLHAKFRSGEINGVLFQSTLTVMGLATFFFVFASFSYYCASLVTPVADVDSILQSRRGDLYWLCGCILLFLEPTLILVSIGLFGVGSVWLALWLVYVLYVARYFPKVQAAHKNGLLT